MSCIVSERRHLFAVVFLDLRRTFDMLRRKSGDLQCNADIRNETVIYEQEAEQMKRTK